MPRALLLALATLILTTDIVALWSRITAVPMRFDDIPLMPGHAVGISRVLAISRSGSTRGGEWFDDLTCISASTGSLNAGQSVTLGWL